MPNIDERLERERAALMILAIRLELDPEDISSDGWYFNKVLAGNGMIWGYQEFQRNEDGSLKRNRHENVVTKERRIVVPPELYQEFLNHKENGVPSGS